LSDPTGTTANNTFPQCDTGGAPASPIQLGNLNTDYSMAQLILNSYGQGVTFRVVASGIRVRYTGNLMNQSGLMHCVQDADHNSLSSLTVGQIGQMESYYAKPLIQNQWHGISYAPANELEYYFNQDNLSNGVTNNGLDHHYYGILLTGLNYNTASFQYEIIVHYEAVGSIVRGKTDTPADPVGLATVTNSIKVDNQKKIDDPSTSVSSLLETGSSLLTTLNAFPMKEVLSLF